MIDAIPPKIIDHAVRSAFEALAAGQLRNPPREETVGRPGDPEYFRLVMPASYTPAGIPFLDGAKIIEEAGARDESGQRRLGARTARLELHHQPTGRRLVLDADRLTDRRTAAAAVWSLRWLLGRLPRLAVIGTGRVAREVVLAADRLLSCESVRAASRSAARCAEFEAGLLGRVQGLVAARPEVDWALEGAQAVIAAVPTPEPLLTPARIAPLQAVVAVEGDPRTQLLDPRVVATGPLIVDDPDQARRSGSLAGLAEVTLARVEGRPATVADAAVGRLGAVSLQRPIVLLTGLAGLDLLAGWAVWEALGGPEAAGSD